MKKIIIIAFTFFLLITSTVSANTPDDFEQLMQYDGYAKEAYENTVKLKAYLHGKYTNTQHYVYETFKKFSSNPTRIDTLKAYVDNEKGLLFQDLSFKDITSALLLDLTATGYSWAATLVDIVSDVFKGFKTETESNIEPDYSFINEYIYLDGIDLRARQGYTIEITLPGYNPVPSVYHTSSVNNQYYIFAFGIRGNSSLVITNKVFLGQQAFDEYVSGIDAATVYGLILSIPNATVNIYKDNVLIENPTLNLPPEHNTFFNTVNNNNYVNNIDSNTYKDLVSIKMYCGSATYDIQFKNSNFYYLNTLLEVDKTSMTTTYNGELCTVGFVKNELKYIDDKIAIITPDKILDVETNEQIDEIGNVIQPEEIPECDGILCWASNIFKIIGSVISSIADLGKTITGLVASFLDMLFHLIVPEDLDFITALFDTLKTTFTEKFAITTDIQNLFKSIFTESTTNPLTDLSFTLPATDTQLSFSVFAVVDDYVPMIKRIISALLALMTLMYVYRKITGSGGVMEK